MVKLKYHPQTPKISHSSIIANFDEGGISYKDLDCFIMSINVKFLLYLTSGANNRCSILPQLWINSLFKIPNNFINESQQYFYNFFKSNLNILDCKVTVPRKNNWKGHPFYYEILKSLEKITSHLPQELENILYNTHLV